MEIRLIDPSETDTLKTALDLVKSVFWDLVALDYDGDAIWEFDNYIAYDSIYGQMAESRLLMWGYFNKSERLIGVLAARPPSHICLFFVDKRAHGRGVGRQIFDVARKFLLDNTASTEITVHSSPYAAEVYRRLGFEATGPETVENGIRYTPMAFPLRPRPAQPKKPAAKPKSAAAAQPKKPAGAKSPARAYSQKKVPAAKNPEQEKQPIEVNDG